jgi:DNA-binding response OmpR family regulator
MRAMAPDRDRPILVVDDDAKIVRLVRMYLERERYRVVEALDGAAALAAVDAHDPALIVLDLMIPEIDGLAVVRAIRDRSDVPIIILSARGTTGDRIEGLSLGADDYLPKPFSPAELVLRVRRVLARSGAGDRPDARPLMTHGGLEVDRARHTVRVDGRPVTVTAVELRLLVTLLEADGRVLSRDQLLDAVYGLDAAEVLDRTIDVHIGRLRDKLADPPGAPRFIATVRGAGYRIAPLLVDAVAVGSAPPGRPGPERRR